MNRHKEIIIQKPVNKNKNINELFPDLNYSIEKPIVKEVNDVFITRSGICGKNLKIIPESVHQYDHLKKLYYKIYLLNFYFRKRMRLKGGPFLIIHNIWCPGYYHWICEALPRLWLVKEHTAELTLLIPENFKNTALESLKDIPFKEIVFIPTKQNVIVDKLILPLNTKKVYETDPLIMNRIREFYLSHTPDALKEKFSSFNRIYVSRKKARSRKIHQEDKLEQFLKTYGFTIVCFEDYTFMEQVAIMINARLFISIHGAGLSNMVFMGNNGVVLELYKERVQGIDFGRVRQTDLPSPCYCRLASVMNHSFLIQFCKAVDPKVPMGKATLIVDMELLKENLELMLKI